MKNMIEKDRAAAIAVAATLKSKSSIIDAETSELVDDNKGLCKSRIGLEFKFVTKMGLIFPSIEASLRYSLAPLTMWEAKSVRTMGEVMQVLRELGGDSITLSLRDRNLIEAIITMDECVCAENGCSTLFPSCSWILNSQHMLLQEFNIAYHRPRAVRVCASSVARNVSKRCMEWHREYEDLKKNSGR